MMNESRVIGLIKALGENGTGGGGGNVIVPVSVELEEEPSDGIYTGSATVGGIYNALKSVFDGGAVPFIKVGFADLNFIMPIVMQTDGSYSFCVYVDGMTITARVDGADHVVVQIPE